MRGMKNESICSITKKHCNRKPMCKYCEVAIKYKLEKLEKKFLDKEVEKCNIYGEELK